MGDPSRAKTAGPLAAVAWHWRRNGWWILAMVAVSLFMGLYDFRENPGALARTAPMMGLMIGWAVSARDPSRLAISSGLAPWRTYFRAGRIVLFAATLPIAVVTAAAVGWRADHMSALYMVQIFGLAWLGHQMGMSSGEPERIWSLVPCLTAYFLLTNPLVEVEGPHRWPLLVAVALLALTFPRANLASLWRERVSGRRSEDFPLTRKLGTPWLWLVLFILHLLADSPDRYDDAEGAARIVLIGLTVVLLLVLSEALLHLAGGGREKWRPVLLAAGIGGAALLAFAVSSGTVFHWTGDIVSSGSGLFGAVEGRIFRAFSWYLLVLGVWAWGERSRGRRVEAWDRQLALMRRLPAGRRRIAWRLVASVWPAVWRSAGMILLASALLLPWGYWSERHFLLLAALSGLMTSLAVAASLYAATAAVALRLPTLLQSAISLLLFLYFFFRISRAELTAFFAGIVLVALLSATVVLLSVGPGGVLSTLLRARSSRLAIKDR